MSNGSKVKKLLKNEWIRTAIMLVIVLVAFFSFWFGIRFALATEYPLLAVASPSMVPTLNVGDLIIVHGISNVSEIYVHPAIMDPNTGKIVGGGDIIIFHTSLPGYQDNLRPGYPDELIVHRAVNKTLVNGVWYFTTKGDANPTQDYWRVPDYYVVGKVVGTVPYVGQIPLFIRTANGIITVVVLIILVLIVEMLYSTYKERQKPQAKEQQT